MLFVFHMLFEFSSHRISTALSQQLQSLIHSAGLNPNQGALLSHAIGILLNSGSGVHIMFKHAHLLANEQGVKILKGLA